VILGTMRPLTGANELCHLSGQELTRRYQSREISPVEVTVTALDRAEEIQPLYNAFTFVDRKGAIEQARASEQRWRKGEQVSAIDGVPTTIKDVVWVKGWSIRYGSLVTDPTPCTEDAPAVLRLRESGAVFLGLTTTPEFGWKAVTDSQLSGVTRNPWSPDSTSGGSSGGAAVAAATGAGVLHLGTDGGGSIRIPASFTGIVGHKPTFGKVAAYPTSAFGTVAHIGPMARTVGDVALMLKIMAGRDIRDWFQGLIQGGPDALTEGVLRGARIGYWWKPPTGDVEPEVAAIVDAAVERIRAIGAHVERVDLPGSNLLEIFQHHWFTGAANRLEKVPHELQHKIDPGFREIASAGKLISGSSLVTAQVRRAEFGAAMDRLLTEYDFLVSPGTAVAAAALEAGQEFPSGSGLPRWSEWIGFNFPINLSQQPACVVPCGRMRDGRPVSLQFVGARGADARVLSAAQDLERHCLDLHPEHLKSGEGVSS
jgi:aspartyl-tRNA(Asn)/glutamyl-tRNA(Gln) amidotransferase subunit A